MTLADNIHTVHLIHMVHLRASVRHEGGPALKRNLTTIITAALRSLPQSDTILRIRVLRRQYTDNHQKREGQSVSCLHRPYGLVPAGSNVEREIMDFCQRFYYFLKIQDTIILFHIRRVLGCFEIYILLL